MAYEHIRRYHTACAQQLPEIFHDLRGITRLRRSSTLSVARARIGECPCLLGDLTGDQLPGRPVIAQAGFEDDGRVPRTAFDDLHDGLEPRGGVGHSARVGRRGRVGRREGSRVRARAAGGHGSEGERQASRREKAKQSRRRAK
jgi:hypothetical protein